MDAAIKVSSAAHYRRIASPCRKSRERGDDTRIMMIRRQTYGLICFRCIYLASLIVFVAPIIILVVYVFVSLSDCSLAMIGFAVHCGCGVSRLMWLMFASENTAR